MGDGPDGIDELISAMTRENIRPRRTNAPERAGEGVRSALVGRALIRPCSPIGFGEIDCVRGEEGGTAAMALQLSSEAFPDGGALPERYGRDGGNVSPPLDWEGVPAGAAELVLLCEDQDATAEDGRPVLHWALAGIEPDTDGLGEGEEPESGRLGRNGFGAYGYDGPQPPPGEQHRYVLTLVAVSSPVEPDAGDLRDEIDARTLEKVSLSFRFGG
jgi:Raf kinase inhibitor-like YbhB/YbcL family protein